MNENSNRNKNVRDSSARSESPKAGRAKVNHFDMLEKRVLFAAQFAGTTPVAADESAAASSQIHVPTLAETSLVKLSLANATRTVTDAYWKALSSVTETAASAAQTVVAESIVPFTINLKSLRSTLAKAPMENTAKAMMKPLVISIPKPDGSLDIFNVWESPIMENGLAKKFRNIKTYAGQSVTDPAESVRFDITPAGLHVQVLGGSGAYYIDPIYVTTAATASTLFASYWRRDVVATQDEQNWTCTVLNADGTEVESGTATLSNNPELDPDVISAIQSSIDDGQGAPDITSNITFSSTLRTFRLACAADGEYVGAVGGGTVAGGQAAIVTAINRVTGVYQTELDIRLVLVANNSNLVYTNASTDPYSNSSSDINVNTSSINSVIGSTSYDIGHVFTTGSGGVAFLGCVGKTNKGGGTTGLPSPTGDAFYIDYVAHEMGHQFGANHTFNTSQDPNRNGSTAYEPGSGSTIMAYAGIEGNEDIQAHSDPYFHSVSIDEIRSYISTIASVGTSTATGNNAPVISAGANYTIPASTPFILTATGSDPDAGQTVTYEWQERDLGAATLLTTADNGSSPLFRDYVPSTSPSRMLPKLSTVLAGLLNTPNTKTGSASFPVERMFTTNRTSHWRVIARDNQVNGGGVSTADMTLNVVDTGDSFAVTSPNSPVSWATNSNQTVTWNVAGTTTNGINTANVNILLSIDGGNTFPFTLAAGTANDGTETITIPNGTVTSQARVKVEAVGNIFFDIGNTNFTIVNGGPAAPATPSLEAADDSGVSNIDRITNFNNSSPAKALTITVGGLIIGDTVKLFSSSAATGSTLLLTTVAASTSLVFTTNGSQTYADGLVSFTATQSDITGTSNASGALAITVDTTAPTLTSYGISPATRTSPLPSTNITFSEPLAGITASNLSLTRDSSPVSLASATITPAGSAVAVTGLSSATSINGNYSLGVSNAGVTDIAGNSLVQPSPFAFVIAIPPSAPTSISLAAASDTGSNNSDGITSRNNASPASALTFTVAGVSAGNTVQIFSNGTLIGSAIATGATTDVTTDGHTTLADGSLNISAVQISGGVTSDASGSTIISVDTVAPSLLSYGIASTIRNTSVSSTTISFSELITGFSAANLSLTQDGVPASLANITATPTGSNFSITGLSPATTATAVYQLAASSAGLTDIAGNILTAPAPLTFTNNVIQLPPSATENVVRLVPSTSNALTIAIYVNSPTLTYTWGFTAGKLLRIDGSTGNDRVLFDGNNNQVYNADIKFTSNGGADNIDVRTGTLRTNYNLGATTSVNLFSAAAVTFNVPQTVSALTLAANSTATANGSLVVDSLSIANDGAPLGTRAYSAFLNLKSNPLVVHNGDAAALSDAVRAWKTTGNKGLGSTTTGGFTTLAVFPNAIPGSASPFYSSFASLPLVASDVLVRFDYNGDLNADGVVDANDVRKLIEGLSTGATGWRNGDINYDGVIDSADYALLDTAFQANLPPL